MECFQSLPFCSFLFSLPKPEALFLFFVDIWLWAYIQDAFYIGNCWLAKSADAAVSILQSIAQVNEACRGRCPRAGK